MSEKGLEQDESIQGRLLESKALFKAFMQNPFTGMGFGHFLKFKWYTGRVVTTPVFKYHNGYMETLMKFGLLGTWVFAWYFFTLIRGTFEIVRISDNYFGKTMGLGLVIFLVTAMAGSMTNSFFSDRGFALTVGVMAGLLPALTYKYCKVEAAEPSEPILSAERFGGQQL
jgi:O-antigen ligase